MSQYPLNEIDDLQAFAEENGVAIVITDGSSTEKAVANNNSLCEVLSHSAEFAPDCARFCGRAHGLATNLNRSVSYQRYAGLTRHAVPCRAGEKPLVAIVVRVFTTAERYREATVSSISGDWRISPPTEVFDNIL